jgi:hypothetical protein
MTDPLEQFRRDFFPNTERHTLTFDILSDDWEALQRLFAENEWEPDEGLRHTLAAGLAYLQGQARLAELNHPQADLAAEVHRLQRERMTVESRYAVMKFRAFSFMQAVKIMEMKLNACRSELEGLRSVNEQLRQRLEKTHLEG